MPQYEVTVASAADADDLVAFAAQRPLVWADFASIAALQPDQPRVLLARDRAGGPVCAAAIDDGLAMSVGGAGDALDAIAATVADLDAKFVVAGRTDDVRRFVRAAHLPRRERLEDFMAVGRTALQGEVEAVPLRVATADDLPLLERVRAAALEEEYGIDVPSGSRLRMELREAVARAVSLQGVAIWTEGDECAFTAQLIAKTTDAAMFGDLYVSPTLRGEGRATRALTAFCAWLMSESDHVVLRVGADNHSAVRLYQRVGFATLESFCSSLTTEPAPGDTT